MGSHSRGSLPAEAAVPLSLFRSHCARRPSSTLPYLSCYQQPYPTDGRTRPEPTNGNRLARKPAIISLDQSRGSLRRRRRRHYSVTSHQQPPDTTSRGDAFTPLALVSNTDRLLSLPPSPILAPSRFSLAFSLPRLDHHPSSSSLSLSPPFSPPLPSPLLGSPVFRRPRVLPLPATHPFPPPDTHGTFVNAGPCLPSSPPPPPPRRQFPPFRSRLVSFPYAPRARSARVSPFSPPLRSSLSLSTTDPRRHDTTRRAAPRLPFARESCRAISPLTFEFHGLTSIFAIRGGEGGLGERGEVTTLTTRTRFLRLEASVWSSQRVDIV